MGNYATEQNQQALMNAQGLLVGDHEKLSRRSWLFRTAIKAASAVMLFFILTGCTKEQLKDVIDKVPGGGVGSQPDTWYHLKVSYKDEDGQSRVGYLNPVGTNATTSFWDYMRISESKYLKFKLHPTKDGWAYWEIDDGNWLSLKATGWAYRSLQQNRIEWKIVDGKLYNNYWASDWQNYPLGAERQRVLVPDAYYVGVNLGGNKVFTCELEPAP